MSIDDLPLTTYEEKPPTVEALKIFDVKSFQSFGSFMESYVVAFETGAEEENPEYYDISNIKDCIHPKVGDYIVKDPHSFDWVFVRKQAFGRKYKEVRK